MGNASQNFWDCALKRAGLVASALRNISSSVRITLSPGRAVPTKLTQSCISTVAASRVW